MRQRKVTPGVGLRQVLSQTQSPLLAHYNHLVSKWEKHFAQTRTFRRVMSLLTGMLCSSGRTTVSSALYYLGEYEGSQYRAFYRALEDAPWNQEDLFESVLLEGLKDYPQNVDICLGGDETHLPKEGRVIPQAKFYHNPLADHFDDRPIQWALRILHFALINPTYIDHRPFSLSVAFANAPAIQPLTRKERERISEGQMVTYKQQQKAMSLPSRATRWLEKTRVILDEHGYRERRLRLAFDASYMNQQVLQNLPHDTFVIGRIRYDARLRYPADEKNGHRVYSEKSVRPWEILKDDLIPSIELQIHLGRRLRNVKVKDVSGLLWKEGSRRQPIRLLVIFPTQYRAPVLPRKSLMDDLAGRAPKTKGRRKKDFNDPVYLLTTDLSSEARDLAQTAADRWGLEVLHRDLKTGVGVGQPQCWNDQAVERVHSALAAAYAMLTLASFRVDRNLRSAEKDPKLGAWRRGYSTPPASRSVRDVLTQFRQEMARFRLQCGTRGQLPADWALTLPETYQLD
jgi:hypothetical protein